MALRPAVQADARRSGRGILGRPSAGNEVSLTSGGPPTGIADLDSAHDAPLAPPAPTAPAEPNMRSSRHGSATTALKVRLGPLGHGGTIFLRITHSDRWNR